MTKQELLDNGYRQYQPPQKPLSGCYSSSMYQKRVERDDKTLYFINVYYYKQDQDRDFSEQYEAEVTLYQSKDDPWMTLQFHNLLNSGVEWLERVIHDAYRDLNCVPDPHNQRE